MESFSVRKTLTLADWQAYQKNATLRIQRGDGSWLFAVAALAAAVCYCLQWLFDEFGLEFSPLSAMVGVAFVVALILVVRHQNQKAALPEQGGAFLGPCADEFSAEGISTTQNGLRSQTNWSRVQSITTSPEHIFIWIDRFAAHVIPTRDLPPGMTSDEVLARLQAWAANKTARLDSADVTIASTTVPENPSSGRFGEPVAPDAAAEVGSKSELDRSWRRAALRLLTLRTTDAIPLSANMSVVVLLSLLSIALWTGFDWLRNTPGPQFYPYGLAPVSWFILAALLTAVTLAYRSSPTVATSRVCMLVAIVIPILLAADFAIDQLVPEQWVNIAEIGLAVYALAYCERALLSMTAYRQPIALAGGLAVTLLFFWAASALYFNPTVWFSSDVLDEFEGENSWAASETILFEQPARIDASVASLVRPADEAPVGFFVGFAGYGEQRVFAEEIKFASQAIAQRYDTSSRSVLLINDRRTLHEQPLASVSGLRHALKGVASKMQLDRDVLFLALSSHGSEDPALSVSNGSIPLRELSGESLAEALRESGIKWRVIMISACHAGAFIKHLKDPNTIVITAAAPERTSFGCSDERDLTYFGEAFFRDSLPNAGSLREAFDSAKKLIAEREVTVGVEESDPQAFFGELMEGRLSEMRLRYQQ